MTTTTTTEWTLPLEQIFADAKERIDNPNFIMPSVEVWFEGEDSPAWKCLVLDMPDDVQHRDACLHAADVMAGASGADYVVLTFDTHASSHQLNPTTGKPWVKGEMQRMCDEEGYCDTGNIRDNLLIAIARRSDGKMLQHMIPYHFHGADESELMFWDETEISEWDEESQGELRGIVPDGMRAAITREPVSKTLERLSGTTVEEMDIPKARFHQIMAGVRILAGTSEAHGKPMMFVSAVRTDDDEEREILTRTMSEAGLENPLDHDE